MKMMTLSAIEAKARTKEMTRQHLEDLSNIFINYAEKMINDAIINCNYEVRLCLKDCCEEYTPLYFYSQDVIDICNEFCEVLEDREFNVKCVNRRYDKGCNTWDYAMIDVNWEDA